MLQPWRRSLEGKLVIRLSGLMLAAMAIGFVALLVYSRAASRKIADEALKDALVADFLHDAAWAFPVIAAVLLAVTVLTVRSSLRPLRAVSENAARIAPGRSGVRLGTVGLPTELAPLVGAVNEALDRLESGFEVQRRFTGDAAHELRTPLAILSAGLEGLGQSEEVLRLRQDAERMNRLVDQLLRVARLDAEPMDISKPVDLRLVAQQVVEHLAPLAIRGQRTVAFEADKAPILVRGDRDALGDAVRNLVENAITHCPAGEEVRVCVDDHGCVSVIDSGPGVRAEHRERIFERFWRSRERRSTGLGAGLGLSIVAEIARAHGGRVFVAEAVDGGAHFVLDLSTARIWSKGTLDSAPTAGPECSDDLQRPIRILH